MGKFLKVSPPGDIIQGFLLSSYMFVISVELLAATVRRNNIIESIKQEDTEKEINQFEDDIILVTAAEEESA